MKIDLLRKKFLQISEKFYNIFHYKIINKISYIISFIYFIFIIINILTIVIINVIYYFTTYELTVFIIDFFKNHSYILFMNDENQDPYDEFESSTNSSEGYFISMDSFNTFIEQVNINKTDKVENEGFFLPSFVIENFINDISKINNSSISRSDILPVPEESTTTAIVDLSCTCIPTFDYDISENSNKRTLDLEEIDLRSIRPRTLDSAISSSIPSNNIVYFYNTEIKTYFNMFTKNHELISINLPELDTNNPSIYFSETILENNIFYNLGEKFSIAKEFKPTLSTSIIKSQDYNLLTYNKFINKYLDLEYEPIYRIYINSNSTPNKFESAILCSDLHQIIKIFGIDNNYENEIRNCAINKFSTNFSNAISLKVTNKSSKIIIYLEENKYIIDSIYKYLLNRNLTN